MRLVTIAALLPFAVGAAIAAAPPPLRVVPELDLQRYSGRWFEIARLPNRFQTKCAGDVTAVYTPRPDGRITVTNRCREASGRTTEAAGVARRVDGRPASVLEVRFAPAFLSFVPAVWGDYQVLALGKDYDHALIGTPDRKYLWVLSRAPRMDAATYQSLLDQAKAQGFDVAAVVKTPQSSS